MSLSNDEPSYEAEAIILNPLISPRVGHSISQIKSSTNAKLVMLGGANEETTTKEVWEIDLRLKDNKYTATCTLSELQFPPLYEFLAVTNKEMSKLWIFGGGTNEMAKNDTFCIDIEKKSIELVEPNISSNNLIPSARTQGGNKCLVELNNCEHLVVFGGGIQGETSVGDANLYLFNTSSKEWSQVNVTSDCPHPRQGHVTASIDSKIFIHGGMSGTSLFDDAYMIDLSQPNPHWMKIETGAIKPSARAAHNITCIQQNIYIFGGLNSSGEALNDLWKFSIESLEWAQIHYNDHKIPPRLDFAFTSVQLEDETTGLVIHGGVNPGGLFFNDFLMIKLKRC